MAYREEPIPLPGRDPMLPALFYAHNHPLVAPGKLSIVFSHDISPERMRTVYEWEKKQTIPKATPAELKGRGLLEVPSDVLVFARELGCTDPAQDTVQAWKTSADMIAQPVKDNLTKATADAMGPPEDITLNTPVRTAGKDGKWTGGLAIERGDGRCEPVKSGTRCYTLANSYQSRKGTWAPAAASKVNGSFDENNLMRRNLNLAVAPFPIAAMQQLPQQTREDIADYTSMLNIPPLGLPGNTAHNTLQMNIAPAVEHGSEDTLTDSLGFYGGNHNDNKDSPARFTTMTMCSRLPDGYTLSTFHIPRLGLYFMLSNFDSANFCGLNYHGGTPPIAPPGAAVAHDAYRITFISYPPERMGDGLGHVVVGAMPTAKDPVLKMSAEMQHVDCDAQSRLSRATTNYANFAGDGQVVMDVRAHVTFMVRMFLLLIIFLSNQLPLSYDFRINSDLFLSSFSFAVDADGNRESVQGWEHGPGYRRKASDASDTVPESSSSSQDGSDLVPQEPLRSAVKRRWRLHYNKHARHIPFAVVNEKFFEIDESGALLEPPIPVSLGVDALGNPIEPGGRPWVKPAAPISKAKAAKGKAKADNDSDDSDYSGPRTRKRRRNGRSEPSSSESDSTPRVLKVYTSAAKRRELAGDHGSIWNSQPYVTLSDDWNRLASSRSGQSSRTMAKALPLMVEMDDAEGDADITMRDDFDYNTFWMEAGGIKLVDRLTSGAISRDHLAVRDACELLDNSDSIPSSSFPLDSAFEGLRSSPGSAETSLAISRIWPQFDSVYQGEAHAMLELKLRRQSVMQMTFCVWSWLDSYCVGVVRAALAGSQVDTWMGTLAKCVQSLMSIRAPARELRAVDFGLSPSLTTVYRYRFTSFDIELPERLVVATVINIIATWLGFPIKSKSRAQAWFVDIILHGCHPAGLFLDCVWYAFGHLETEIFGNSNAKIPDPSAYIPLVDALSVCPLADQNSVEFLSLLEIQRMLLTYRERSIAAPPGAIPPLRISESDAVEVQNMSRFLNALLELEPLIDGFDRITSPSIFQATVQGRLDFLLPFREHGPSRARSRLPGNSFDPTHARTRGGLLSGLIFRGIIFATPFSMEAGTYFDDPPAWQAEVARFAEQPSDFFCNLAAYSRRKSNRGVHLVQTYWSAINDPACPDWEANTSDGEYDFTECFKFLKGASRFSEIGDLIGFLLTADFAYAGAVKMPSIETVGSLIRDINKGGMKGLEELKLIPRRQKGAGTTYLKGDAVAVRPAVDRLYRFLDIKLSDASKAHMGFDGIMLENGLCKLTRWLKLKLVKL